MHQSEIIQKILQGPEFSKKPPVLVDIGASGQIHPEWEAIAPYAVCLAFDADSRDFNETAVSGYKRQIMVNAIVSDKDDAETDFYLTSSPHCSSTLEPLEKELSVWSFADLFRTEKKIKLKNMSLSNSLRTHSVTYVDWFKTDSQGIDLRLFNDLAEEVRNNVIVAEFEPGFINAYSKEDKIPGLLAYMETRPFWLSDCIVKGSQRISKETLSTYKLDPSTIQLRNSACWAEFCYINTCERFQSSREIWLTIVFCIIKRQYGFALDLLQRPELKKDAMLHQATEGYLLGELNKSPKQVQNGVIQKLKRLLKG